MGVVVEEMGVVERARERVGGREGVNGNAGKVGLGWEYCVNEILVGEATGDMIRFDPKERLQRDKRDKRDRRG